MGTTSDKATYLYNTKQLLKDKINSMGGNITDNTTFREYVDELDNIAPGGNFVLPTNTRFSNSTFTIFPDGADFSEITDAQYMFYSCTNLEEVNSIINLNSCTSCTSMFQSCSKLEAVTITNTNNVTNMGSMFNGCTALITIPVFETNNVGSSGFRNVFTGCTSLSNTSLNNILQMCINATKVGSSYKKLSSIGLTSAQATTCQSLSNYQAFVNAGWSTGY